ncbi:MAG TPA: hypothetical protein VHR41_19085 [Gemmatimonadales bacterium]|jgi:hypothetical protein|nr:hypothetical protein [Gemmatimonadales bacterium]
MLTLPAQAFALVGVLTFQTPTAVPATPPVLDSVVVPVAFSATGGSITRSGLYTAGATAGTYRVIASSTGLADTAVVTLTSSAKAATVTRAPSGQGIPFGPSGGFNGSTGWKPGMEPFTGTISGTSPDAIITQLNTARAAHRHVIFNMTGGSHNRYLTGGEFDRGKWQAVMDGYDTPEIKAAVAAAVADGTLLGNSVMDEPNVHGLGDGNTWGPSGTMTKARVDSMCAVVKALFPTLPVGVGHQHDAFQPQASYRVCEFIIDQYSSRAGDVTAFRDAGLALARRDHHAIVFSMNILNGGIQAVRDGSWNCPTPSTGGRGTGDPNCRMTAEQVRTVGLTLGPAGCALLMWRYDRDFMSNPENEQAFKDVGARLAALPGRPCTRS